jgi:gas vesicle protein
MANKISKLLMVGLAGVAAGVVIGMLFAPSSGTKTRKRLKKGIRDLSTMEGDDLSEKIRSFAQTFSHDDADEKEEPSSAEGK